jgi:hypothetical protein
MPGTPLIKKFGIKPKQRIIILNAPDGYREQLGELPADVELATTLNGTFDLVHVFVKNKAEVDKYAPTAIQAVKPGGLLWFSYPKKSAKIPTDISRDVGWDTVFAAGWRPVTLISIDDVWSAFRFRPLSEVK